MSNPTLQTAYEEFMLHQTADGLSAATLSWYRSLLGQFVEDRAGTPLSEIVPHVMREYVAALRQQQQHWNGSQRILKDGALTEDTISAHIRALHKFWRWAAAEYGVLNPMRTLKYPQKRQGQPKALPFEDLLKLFEACDNTPIGRRDRAILAFLVDTGCRAGGVVGLRLVDVDLAERRAIVTEKRSKTRAVLFLPHTADILRAWIRIRLDAPYLFYNMETLQPLRVNGVRQMLKRLARRAGLDPQKVTTHVIRHTFAKEYLRAGGNLATLSRLMGHSDVTTTVQHYTIFTDDETAAAHELYSPARKLTEDVTDSED